ncbi:hypothetical protein B0H63DRAFT_482574 [Podospora didyma]|uniref:Gfd2/YDR514C-like C-terminal domain-containing protein n=1 Tax=Podospora didyma TaxID=330526 RepID=A0AAE0KGD3_9PEZI|nr:hypothetical protein B0H63DRAFT_482574 [Podospora didyma]
MDDDADFLRRLQALTGGDGATWDGFDPAAWRSIPLSTGEEPSTGTDRAASPTGGFAHNVASATPSHDYDDDDDSAHMIFGVRHLKMDELPPQTRSYKLSKARELASEERDVVRDVPRLEKVGWPDTGLKPGDKSPAGATFVPWRFVTDYPLMYVGKRNSVLAAPLFEPEGIHQNRIWDFFYIHQPPDLDSKPVLFVPTYQFQHLLDVVNAKLEINLTIPHGVNSNKFTISFGIGNTPLPRFLGRSTSLEAFESLCEAIPPANPRDSLEQATQYGRDEFLKLLSSINNPKKKPQKSSEKNRLKRIQNHKAWGRSIKRVQRYLGLREKVDASRDESSEGGAPTTTTPTLDLSKPMATTLDQPVMFIAVDLEAYEFNHNLVTEIGLAMLDTADITATAPGDEGKVWFPHIRARHLRIKENAWALNTTHVQGCADHFEFGKSEFISKTEVVPALEKIIDNAVALDGSGEKRPVVLVFHESKEDVKYLRTLGYDISGAKNVIDLADTREMHQYIQRELTSTKLQTILGSLNISCRYLHNAGNDAAYTLRAMIALAVKKRLASPAVSQEGNSQGHIPYAEFVDKAREGWSSGGEDSDGGEPHIGIFEKGMDQAD